MKFFFGMLLLMHAATSLVKTPQRFSNVIWGNDNVAIVSDEWYDTRNTKTYLINPSNQIRDQK